MHHFMQHFLSAKWARVTEGKRKALKQSELFKYRWNCRKFTSSEPTWACSLHLHFSQGKLSYLLVTQDLPQGSANPITRKCLSLDSVEQTTITKVRLKNSTTVHLFSFFSCLWPYLLFLIIDVPLAGHYMNFRMNQIWTFKW